MIHPHDAMIQLEENLWTVEGAIPRLPIKRRMTVIRLSDGRLVLHSPMMLRPEAMKELEALGPIAFAIVPNGFHRMGAPRYKKQYPGIQIVAPKRSRKRISQAVDIDLFIEDFPSDPHLQLETLEGGKVGEAVLRVTSEAGETLVFNDMLFNVHHVPKGLGGCIYRLIGSIGGPKVTPTARIFLTKSKKKLAIHLERLARTPDLKRLIPGHGDIVDQAAAEALMAAASKL